LSGVQAVSRDGKGGVYFHVKCRKCGKEDALKVTEEEYENWWNGDMIQVAFPRMSAGEREIFVSGYCEKCFEELFVT
jgi:hypothetical protein